MSWCKNVGPSTCVIHAGDVSVNRLSLNHRCCRTDSPSPLWHTVATKCLHHPGLVGTQ